MSFTGYIATLRSSNSQCKLYKCVKTAIVICYKNIKHNSEVSSKEWAMVYSIELVTLQILKRLSHLQKMKIYTTQPVSVIQEMKTSITSNKSRLETEWL